MTPISTFLGLKQEEMDTAEKRGAYAVAVVGCGREGLFYGTAFAEAGFKVALVDPDRSLIKRLIKGQSGFFEREIESRLRTLWRTGRLAATDDLKDAVLHSDIILVTTNPKIDEKTSVNYSEVEKACKQVGANLKRGTIVIYTGIAGFGFIESVVREALVNASGLKVGEDFGLAYSPLLMFNQRPSLEAISNCELKVAANDKISLDSASAVLATITKRGVKHAVNFRTIELATLFSALRLDANIALTNELAVLCEKAGTDYLEIMKLLDSQQTLSSLVPTINEDLRREVYILIESAENLNTKLRLATLTRQLNEDMIRHAVNLTQNALRSCGRTLRRSRITVLGATRPGTPGEIFVKMLETKGAKTSVFDPTALVCDNINRGEKPKRSIADLVEGSDCMVLLLGQELPWDINLKNLRTVMRSPSAIIDLSGTLDPEKAEIEGFIYRGLGRGTGRK